MGEKAVRKKISVFIPTFNEIENIRDFITCVIDVMSTKLPQYDYEIMVIDNNSFDGTQDVLRELCIKNKKIKTIFNAKNYGSIASPFHGLLQCEGDAIVFIPADFQDPPELIETFVHEWEQGAEVVLGHKNESHTNRVMHFLRGLYYKIINAMSDVELLDHCTDFGLYDKSFINLLRDSKDNQPYIRGFVAKYAKSIKLVDYIQQKRRAGKSKFNFYRLYDYAMVGFTSYTKVGMRLAVFAGMVIAIISVLIGIVYLIYKLLNWNTFDTGALPILIGVFFIGGAQMFFIGFLGEYILAINYRSIKQPLVREKQRLNFDIVNDSERKESNA
jgi:glycosyltransferase involved in cell wall biosynthesis